MTAADQILVVGAVVLLFAGFGTGIAMSRARLEAPDTPKYLRFAHLASYSQAPILLALVLVMGFSGLSAGYNTATAAVVTAGAFLLVAKDLVNWRAGTRDEFAEKTAGYRLGAVSGVVQFAGLGMIAVAVVSGF